MKAAAPNAISPPVWSWNWSMKSAKRSWKCSSDSTVEKDRGGESMATAVGGGTGFPFGRDGAVTLQRCSPDNMIELCFRQLEACLVFWEL